MANRRILLLDGYYLNVDKPDGPTSYWCVTLGHDSMDVEMNVLDCSVHGFNRRRTAIGNAIADLLQMTDYARLVPPMLYPYLDDADVQLICGRQYALDELRAKYVR